MKKILWIAAGIILFLSLLYFGVPVLIKHYLGKMIEKRNQTQSALSVNYEELNSRWPWKLIEFQGLKVNIKDCQPGEKNSLSIRAASLIIDNISWSDLIFNRELKVENVQISDWNLEIIRDPSTKDFYLSCLRKGGKRFPPFNISHFITDQGKVSFKELGDSMTLVAEASPTLSVQGFFKSGNKQWKYDLIDIDVEDLIINTGSELYQFQIGAVEFDSRENLLQIDSLDFKTKYTEEEVADQTGVKTHWYQMSIPRIQAINFKLDSLFFNDHLELGTLKVDTGSINIYYDKRPDRRDEVYKPLPHEWLTGMPWSLKFDTVELSEISIKYREHVKEWTYAGELDFSDIDIGIEGFDSRKDTVLNATANAIFVDQASLHVRFELPAIEDLQYRVNGTLGSMDITAVNPMLALVTNTHIDSGTSDHLDFWIDHDPMQAGGKLEWQYHDLKVAMNEQKDEGNLLKKVKGFVINTFVVKRDNVKEDLRPGPISFERDTTKSVINYWWKSIASGLKSSVQ